MDARPAGAPAVTAAAAPGRSTRCADANRLVHGDNLEALGRLAATHAERFRCVYLDPPFNTGRRFETYDDRRAPGEWEDFMRPRLAAIAPLVAPDGAVFAEIDDTELGTLQRLLDETFGRGNRVSTVTVVRSAATGHKAQNRGPVNVTDFVLVYAKDKARWRCTPLVRPRKSYDAAYALFVEDHEQPHDAWRIVPLRDRVARELGFPSAAAARAALGRSPFEAQTHAFALTHAGAVCRYAQPRYDAVSKAARALIDLSRREPKRIFLLPRSGRAPLLLRGGNRILFLATKVAEIEGEARLVEPLTNVWDDVPFQGIAREGGVAFVRNKKPERLLARVLAMATEPGDWVLDPFLGSGTTAAVAHKMGRRWVGVEASEAAAAMAVARLRRVVAGEDATGITRAFGWRGGGEFHIST